MQGYKWMHLKKMQNGITNTQETGRLILSMLDPRGVEIRKRRGLRHRSCNTEGPKFATWCGTYDKLKPRGIAIHVCLRSTGFRFEALCGYMRTQQTMTRV